MGTITWIIAHKEGLGIAFASLYAFVRAVVALTPTPKDDASLEKVTPWVRIPAKLLGLDLKQGVNTTPTLTPLDPPPDLPSRPDPPARTDGEWGGRNPRDLVK